MGFLANKDVCPRVMVYGVPARERQSEFLSFMRLCVLTSSFPQYPGDYSGIFVHNQVVGLSRWMSIDVVYTATAYGRHADDEPFRRIPVRYPFRTVPMASVRGVDTAHAVELFNSMARAGLRHAPYDAYLAYWAIPSGLVATAIKRDKPLIVWLGGSDINTFGQRFGFKQAIAWTLRRASHVIGVSSELVEKAQALGLERSRASVIPSGVDVETFFPVDKARARAELGLPDGLLIAFVGSLLPVKRVDRIIRAVASLRRAPECSIVLLGDGPEREALEALARSVGVTCHFAGRVPNGQVPAILGACDVFMMASESEGTPTSAQEAMACGLPVVALNTGGLKDLVGNGRRGLVVGTERELVSALRHVLSDDGLRLNMGTAARRFAVRELALETSVHRTAAVLQEVATSKSKVGRENLVD